MADWSPNNRADTSVWMALRILEQVRLPFRLTGDVAIRDLAFWNATASADVRHLLAGTLAQQLDNIFRLIDGAVYEPRVTNADAVGAMLSVLTDGARTVADLAATADAAYHFWGEPS